MASALVSPSPTAPRTLAPPEAFLGERALPRVAIAFPVWLHVAGRAAPYYARARDLSVAGVGVESPQPLPLPEIRSVTLATPEGRMQLAAQGRWQAEEAAGQRFAVGICFPAVERVALDRLWALVHGQSRRLLHRLARAHEIRDLGLDHRLQLIHGSRLREARAGETLYQLGQRAPGEDSIFLVLDGEVALEGPTPDGKALMLDRAVAGDLIGGLPRLARLAADHAARVSRDASMLELPAAGFEKFMEVSPRLALELAAAVLRGQLARRPGGLDRCYGTGSSAGSSGPTPSPSDTKEP
jgi:CRP-like cAMP-binding protein